MSAATTLYAATVALIVALATAAAWWARSGRARVAAAIVAVAILPRGRAALEDLLGRPRPLAPEDLVGIEDPVVLGAKLDEGRAILVLLDASA